MADVNFSDELLLVVGEERTDHVNTELLKPPMNSNGCN